MRKRTLTLEQIEQREARRAAVKLHAARVKAMTPEQRLELSNRAGVTTIEARALSPFNTCLVYFQNPSATVVGGFRQWLKSGRSVIKGQHGLSIWVPIGHKNENGDLDEKTGFVAGTVFDIAQTQEVESEMTA